MGSSMSASLSKVITGMMTKRPSWAPTLNVPKLSVDDEKFYGSIEFRRTFESYLIYFHFLNDALTHLGKLGPREITDLQHSLVRLEIQANSLFFPKGNFDRKVFVDESKRNRLLEQIDMIRSRHKIPIKSVIDEKSKQGNLYILSRDFSLVSFPSLESLTSSLDISSQNSPLSTPSSTPTSSRSSTPKIGKE